MKKHFLIVAFLISLMSNLCAQCDNSDANSIKSKQQIKKFSFKNSIKIDETYPDFREYESILGSHNIKYMNKAGTIISDEIYGIYNRYSLSIEIGYSFKDDNNHDSLEIEFRSILFGLHFGYNIIDSKRIILTPEFALKWNRFRLLNYNKESNISIEQYIVERDLDIRFNQLTGFLGLNLSFKLYELGLTDSDYMSVGMYGGYIFKLNDKSWIYSKGNRLTGNNNINLENFSWGILFSFHIN